MSNRFIVLPAAERDLVETHSYIAQDSITAADRFYAAARAEFAKLAEMPSLGARRETSNPALPHLRSRRIQGFGNWIVFYRPSERGIDVIRVLHGARDIGPILAEETADEQG